MGAELKPCPFCGNVNVYERLYFIQNCLNDLPLLKLKIACSARDCGAKIELEEHTKNASFKEIELLFGKARLTWNSRSEVSEE